MRVSFIKASNRWYYWVNKKRGPYSFPLQQKRRLRILLETRLRFATDNFSALTMQNSAETSEFSLKTIYNLFGSRESLLLEAALGLLNYLDKSPPIVNVSPGIDRLLAYTEQAMKGFEAELCLLNGQHEQELAAG